MRKETPGSGLCRAQLATSTTAHLYQLYGVSSVHLWSTHSITPHSTGGRLAHHIGQAVPFGMTRQFAAQVKADKEREVRAGHDGTWVAHPALVGVALDIFNAGMSTPNQVGFAPWRTESHMLEADIWWLITKLVQTGLACFAPQQPSMHLIPVQKPFAVPCLGTACQVEAKNMSRCAHGGNGHPLSRLLSESLQAFVQVTQSQPTAKEKRVPTLRSCICLLQPCNFSGNLASMCRSTASPGTTSM